ncbi:MAG TPA: glycosyltransferase [Patescibacteria group bacterium]|nr:glycosyltransferase [Patescibacteria group bacterium]
MTKELNIVIPVYNEDKNFANTYNSIEKYVKIPHTIHVVYDFDEDTTVPVVKRLAKNDPKLKLVKNTIGRGPLNALRSGFAAVKSGPVLVVMADLSDDLKDVSAMMDLYNQGNQIVCGSRYARGGKQIGGPFIKRTLSRTAGVSLHYLRGIPTHDITNNFKLYDSELLHDTTIESKKGFCVAMEITVKAFLAGKKIAEVPSTWRDRTEGEANFKLMAWLPEYMRWYFFAFRPKKKS